MTFKRCFWLPLIGGSMLFGQAAGPLTLDGAVREAVSNNLDLTAAKFGISVAQARQITARLRPNPVVSLSADHLDLMGTGFNSANNAGPNEFAWRTDFVLERGRKREARMNLAAAEASAAELRFQDAVRRLVYDVQSAFVDVQAARETIRLAQDNLRTLNAIVAINTERVRTGDLAGVELERSRLAAMQYQTAVRQGELQLKQAIGRLQFLLGRTALSEDLDVAGPLRRDDGVLNLEAIRTGAMQHRPDLLETRQAEVRNQADLRLQIAQGRIDYSAGMEYRRQQGVNGTGNSLGFFVSAPLPVFNRNQGEILRAQREIGQATAQIHAQEARVTSEVAAAWQQYSSARALLDSIEKNMLVKAREVRDVTEYSYRRGEATLVEFLDAQRAFNDIMQSYGDARANYARSLYLIDSVTGSSLTSP
jgi:cobalt-zinc-cadmium efflux system outer membrane protein